MGYHLSMRLKGWLWLLSILFILNLLLGLFGRQWRFDSIVIHHSAGKVGDYETIRAQHEKRGWSDAAYHLLLSNGSTQVPIGYLEASNHFRTLSFSGATRNHETNLRALQLCVVGDYESDPVPEEIKAPLAHALLALCEEFSIPTTEIIFHKDVGNTVCPGKYLTKEDVTQWMEELMDDCPEPIEDQHWEIIGTSSLSLWSYPRGLLALHAAVSGIFCAVWFTLLMAFAPRHKRRAFSRRPSRNRPSSRTASRKKPSRKKPKKNRHTS